MGDDAVADGEAGDALAERDDLAGAVGDRDEREARARIIAARHRDVDEVEARGALADQHLAALRFRGGDGGGAEGVQPRLAEFDGFHGFTPVGRSMGLSETSCCDIFG